jgi:hypothetical protein
MFDVASTRYNGALVPQPITKCPTRGTYILTRVAVLSGHFIAPVGPRIMC